MRDDGNDEMFKGILKTLIPFDGVVNWDRVLKLKIELEATMLHIYEIRKKDISHRVRFRNVRI